MFIVLWVRIKYFERVNCALKMFIDTYTNTRHNSPFCSPFIYIFRVILASALFRCVGGYNYIRLSVLWAGFVFFFISFDLFGLILVSLFVFLFFGYCFCVLFSSKFINKRTETINLHINNYKKNDVCVCVWSTHAYCIHTTSYVGYFYASRFEFALKYHIIKMRIDIFRCCYCCRFYVVAAAFFLSLRVSCFAYCCLCVAPSSFLFRSYFHLNFSLSFFNNQTIRNSQKVISTKLQKKMRRRGTWREYFMHFVCGSKVAWCR